MWQCIDPRLLFSDRDTGATAGLCERSTTLILRPDDKQAVRLDGAFYTDLNRNIET
jgi:hypothetical protein